MHRPQIFNHRRAARPRFRDWRRTALQCALGALALTAFGSAAAAAQAAPKPLSGNDVSILFPIPKSQGDLANLIALSDLTGPSGAPEKSRLWSEKDFARFLEIAESPVGAVAGSQSRIGLPLGVKQIDAWFIAGIRFDPGAPGLSKSIIEKLGQQPQIRFVAQPVTKNANGSIVVHDIAAHLIFSFSVLPPKAGESPGCLPRSIPDETAFKAVVRDVAALRDQLAAGAFKQVKVQTTGPLNVHPGLKGRTAAPFKNALKALLEKHLAPPRLTSMAIMGLHEPEPWIFVAMQKVEAPPGSEQFIFVPAPSPTLDGKQFAQMLNFRGGRIVQPAPATNNQNDITCRHAAFQPPFPKEERKGVATADFFNGTLDAAKVKTIIDIIADPVKSHFFNTDCVSCHTDTRQGMRLLRGFTVPGVATEALPKDDWNVRNFGWFDRPTITRRTATETAEVVNFINKELLGR